MSLVAQSESRGSRRGYASPETGLVAGSSSAPLRGKPGALLIYAGRQDAPGANGERLRAFRRGVGQRVEHWSPCRRHVQIRAPGGAGEQLTSPSPSRSTGLSLDDGCVNRRNWLRFPDFRPPSRAYHGLLHDLTVTRAGRQRQNLFQGSDRRQRRCIKSPAPSARQEHRCPGLATCPRRSSRQQLPAPS